MPFNYTFKRVEAKYLMDERQYAILLKGLAGFMQPDDYGLSTICNIYYDTENYDLIRRSLDKPQYKEKLRLRSYGVPSGDSTAFIELKKKYKGIVYKRRVSLPYSAAEAYLNRGVKPDSDSQILREIDYFVNYYHPVPRCFIAYDRIAYFGIEDPSLRVTFDRNIRFRCDELALAYGDHGKTVLPEGKILMEIKIPGAMPLPLAALLTELEIYPVSFSKYGRVYACDIINGGKTAAILKAPQSSAADSESVFAHRITV